MTTDLSAIKRWYSGKALQIVAEYVLPTLALAEAQGYWPKGASRKVWAALNKQTVAIKFARANDKALSAIKGKTDDFHTSGWPIGHAMMFGHVGHAPQVVDLALDLNRTTRSSAERELLKTGLQWGVDCQPLAELLKLLDETRPKPVVVMGSLSRTVVANVGQSMGVALDRIESPPIEWTWVTRTEPGTGRVYRVAVGKILWPAGTRHNVSRFASGSNAGNRQCHACGHAIFNPWNWVPLLASGWDVTSEFATDGPLSLWVGRDCAERLFAVDVTGDAEYSNREAP